MVRRFTPILAAALIVAGVVWLGGLQSPGTAASRAESQKAMGTACIQDLIPAEDVCAGCTKQKRVQKHGAGNLTSKSEFCVDANEAKCTYTEETNNNCTG